MDVMTARRQDANNFSNFQEEKSLTVLYSLWCCLLHCFENGDCLLESRRFWHFVAISSLTLLNSCRLTEMQCCLICNIREYNVYCVINTSSAPFLLLCKIFDKAYLCRLYMLTPHFIIYYHKISAVRLEKMLISSA